MSQRVSNTRLDCVEHRTANVFINWLFFTPTSKRMLTNMSPCEEILLIENLYETFASDIFINKNNRLTTVKKSLLTDYNPHEVHNVQCNEFPQFAEYNAQLCSIIMEYNKSYDMTNVCVYSYNMNPCKDELTVAGHLKFKYNISKPVFARYRGNLYVGNYTIYMCYYERKNKRRLMKNAHNFDRQIIVIYDDSGDTILSVLYRDKYYELRINMNSKMTVIDNGASPNCSSDDDISDENSDEDDTSDENSDEDDTSDENDNIR